MSTSGAPSAADILGVKSRVSWGAIAAGAMVALTIYIVLSLLGLALGVEIAVRGETQYLSAGTAIYSIIALLLAMFFGGWTTSRMAVGEDRTEAVLYGLIVWGVLFLGMMWLVSAGLRTGFGAIVGTASGVYADDAGRVDIDHLARDMKRAGVDDATVDKYRDYADRLRNDPGAATEMGKEAAASAAGGTRQATWWALLGVIVSVVTVIFGSLVGSGEVLQPVPILGVQRTKKVVIRP